MYMIDEIIDECDDELKALVKAEIKKQEKRRKLMPIANKYGIEELMEACKYYFDKTGRRLTF